VAVAQLKFVNKKGKKTTIMTLQNSKNTVSLYIQNKHEMQGIKDYQEKLFLNFRLSEHVPTNNFYRQLKEILDLSYIRTMTKQYYGTEGQKSIDPEVFFKLMLIGYFENINSDRKIIEQAQLRLDMLYFLGYDLDEPLPWHSTLSRTRKLLGQEVFLELFRNILRLCIERGMVKGQTQAIDSAYIKANASMDSLEERDLATTSQTFFNELTANEEDQPKSNLKCSERLVSTSDSDARVSKKPGKSRALNHLGIISVDTANHIICGATVDFADKRDSETTAGIVGQTLENLQDTGLVIEEVLADTGYSSGETYKFLEEHNITAYIPPHGGYKQQKDGFEYHEKGDYYTCQQGIKLPFKNVKKETNRNTLTKQYRATTTDCKSCPHKAQCCKNRNCAQVEHTMDKSYYDKAYKLINTSRGKRKRRLRTATVEPVWGTLLHFRRMKKVYTKGNELANKQLLMAATAYNLKKFMNFNPRKNLKIAAMAIKNTFIESVLTNLSQFLLFIDRIFLNRNYDIRKCIIYQS
jgi:transposase